jgi:hypothetical protein
MSFGSSPLVNRPAFDDVASAKLAPAPVAGPFRLLLEPGRFLTSLVTLLLESSLESFSMSAPSVGATATGADTLASVDELGLKGAA